MSQWIATVWWPSRLWPLNAPGTTTSVCCRHIGKRNESTNRASNSRNSSRNHVPKVPHGVGSVSHTKWQLQLWDTTLEERLETTGLATQLCIWLRATDLVTRQTLTILIDFDRFPPWWRQTGNGIFWSGSRCNRRVVSMDYDCPRLKLGSLLTRWR